MDDNLLKDFHLETIKEMTQLELGAGFVTPKQFQAKGKGAGVESEGQFPAQAFLPEGVV